MTTTRYPVLSWLTSHPDSTAAEVARATRLDGRTVAAVLRREHSVSAHRENGVEPWRYRVVKRARGSRS